MASMVRLVEKLLPNMAEKMRFCVFLMDHGKYNLPISPMQGTHITTSVFRADFAM